MACFSEDYSAPMDLDTSRTAEIEELLGQLEIERETVETAMADIRAQLDARHDDTEWRAKARAALRYRGIDHQAVIREIGALRREQKALNHKASENEQPFPNRFVGIAKAMLPAETYGKIRDMAIASFGTVSEGNAP